jgi:hypothetical protein
MELLAAARGPISKLRADPRRHNAMARVLVQCDSARTAATSSYYLA